MFSDDQQQMGSITAEDRTPEGERDEWIQQLTNYDHGGDGSRTQIAIVPCGG